MENKNSLLVDNYGELLAQVNDMTLISFETDGGYQGSYVVVLTDGERLFYYLESYGSCSGCDWLEDVGRDRDYASKKRYRVPYKEALDFCGGLKPKYIVPKDTPMAIKNNGEYGGFDVTFPVKNL